jgi:hypothetical protein
MHYGEFLGLVDNPQVRKRTSTSALARGEREGMATEGVEDA